MRARPLLYAWEGHIKKITGLPRTRRIVAANRDEYKDRPALPLHVWPDGIVAGRDVSKSGTWLGVHPGRARLTFLTNAWNVDNDVDVATVRHH